MIRPRDLTAAKKIDADLTKFERIDTVLPGIASPKRKSTLISQIIESMRRIEYVELLRNSPMSAGVADPHNAAFNPIKAAIFNQRQGRRDEAFWLVFLVTHFGKHTHNGWGLLRAVYGKLGATPFWSWREYSANGAMFRNWLRQNQTHLSNHKFGNHRKYETVRLDRSNGLADVLASYSNWIGLGRSHDQKIGSIIGGVNDPHVAFDMMFRDSTEIKRWGRLAKFDHLTMLDKVGLVDLKPGKTYLSQATGPRRGAALLFLNDADRKLSIPSTEATLVRLGDLLGVGQQVIEDALCNWQKSPDKFVPFR